jgi:L-threonylcarbamoyladenylate synthase
MTLFSDSPNNRSEIIHLVKKGGLVAIPTDTVYGLAALINSEIGVNRILEIKTRSLGQGMPVLINSIEHLESLTTGISDIAWGLARRFWPGKLTMVLPAHEKLLSAITNKGTVAIRWPNHDVPRAIMDNCGFPITGTSANLHGMGEPISATNIEDQIGEQLDAILDGGHLTNVQPSTIINMTTNPIELIRAGAVTFQELAGFCEIKMV